MMTRARIPAWLLAGLLAMTGCYDTLEAGGAGDGPVDDSDPLDLTSTAEPGSLDYLHQTIIEERCSGEPGLCHNGQFEPNLSTPASTYAYLVNRPSLEKRGAFRVAPGAPETSVFIDKLRGRNVATMMPLGADPLSEEEIQMFEQWILDGALRRPGAEPAPLLNNPPAPPEVAVFDDMGNRLDELGPVTVPVGTTLVLRHSASDFETDEADIPFAAFVLARQAGGNVVLRPGVPEDPHLGITMYEPGGGPMGIADTLDFKFEFTLPATFDIRYDDGTMAQVPAAGQVLTPIAVYIDGFPDGIARFTISPRFLTVE